MISRRGIYYDLRYSPHTHDVGNFTFVFSSKLHLDKFKRKLEENRKDINKSLSNRFGYMVDVSNLADIVLYRKVETRGFLIVTKGGTELCQSNIIFGGGIVTKKNSGE